jgi:2-oxo-3-hexenedioate decarboxylase
VADAAGSISAIAARLIAAYDTRSVIDRMVTTEPDFDVPAAYAVLHEIERDRHARGWQPAGRKIGFTNQTIWERYGVSGPMWARMWDRTVIAAVDGVAEVALEPFVQPRIEPEVVFGIAASPPTGSGDPAALLSCVEWMAAGFEIVQCHFAEWRFDAAECTAAFGLHGALVVGNRRSLRDRDPVDLAALADTLATFTLTLCRAGEVVERGSGANVLGSPVLALDFLTTMLAGQEQFAPLAAGEIVTTGTLTDAQPIEPGDVWASDYGALELEGLTVTFI